MSEAIGLTGRPVAVDVERLLAEQVSGDLVAVQSGHRLADRLPAPPIDGGRRGARLTLVAGQAAVLGEQGGHPLTVAAVGAAGVGLNDLAQRQAIEQFLQIPAHGAPLQTRG